MDISDCTILKIDHKDTHSFSNLIQDYLQQNDFLKNFYAYELNWDGVEKAIQERKKHVINRQLLVQVLKKQYENRDTFHKVDENIELLAEENTFTICSAHQPNLLTGHLYFFYKIIHSIYLCNELKNRFPSYNFVPVFYIGSEDNDFEELNHFYFRKKTYTWKTSQTGAVGRMRGIELENLKKELYTSLGNHDELLRELIRLIEECYNPQYTIAEATARFLHELLSDYGLVVINPDDKLLKRTYTSIIKDELLHQSSFAIVSETSKKLSERYTSQAFIRELNLFYLKENIRERIIFENNLYKINTTDIVFTQEEILAEVENHPERFSPNVILRGLYQETILPNIAFIGGGSEVAYWMQLKELFEHHKVFFPMLILRQSIQFISKNTFKNIEKNKLSWSQAFDQKDKVLKEIIEGHQTYLDLSKEKNELQALIQNVQNKVQHIDPNLTHTASSIQKGIEDIWNRLQKKMYKAEKKKWSITQSQLHDIHAHIFPENTLQERKENILEYYTQYGSDIFTIIYNCMHPFGEKFSIVILDK